MVRGFFLVICSGNLWFCVVVVCSRSDAPVICSQRCSPIFFFFLFFGASLREQTTTTQNHNTKPQITTTNHKKKPTHHYKSQTTTASLNHKPPLKITTTTQNHNSPLQTTSHKLQAQPTTPNHNHNQPQTKTKQNKNGLNASIIVRRLIPSFASYIACIVHFCDTILQLIQFHLWLIFYARMRSPTKIKC